VFFALVAFDLFSGGSWLYCKGWPFSLRLGQSILELDKSNYLDFIIPFALDPTRRQAALNKNRPFYASIAPLYYDELDSAWILIETMIVKKAVILECLRMEMAKVETGVWPELQKTVLGVSLEIRETEDGVEIFSSTEIKGSKEEPFVVKLKN